MPSFTKFTIWLGWPFHTSLALALVKPLLCSLLGYCGILAASPGDAIDPHNLPSFHAAVMPQPSMVWGDLRCTHTVFHQLFLIFCGQK